MDKSEDAFRTISEAAEDLDLPQHVLRFWETRFPQIRPLKRGGGRRYYRPDDLELLRAIRHLLYSEGYTIKGVQRMLKERGVREVIGLQGEAPDEAPARAPASSFLPAAPAPLSMDSPVAHTEHARDAHDADRERAASAALSNERSMRESTSSRAATPATHPTSAVWTSAQREKIEAVLAELAECRRILGAAHL